MLLPAQDLRAEPEELSALCSPASLSPSLSSGGSGDTASVRTAQRMIDRATADYAAGRYVDAIRELRVAYQISPVPDILYNLAQSCRAAGQLESALALVQALRQLPLKPALREVVEQRERDLRQSLAQTKSQEAARLLVAKEPAQAQRLWEQAYALSPQPAFLFHIAQAQRLSGQSSDAVVSYERFLNESSDVLLRREAGEQLARLRAERLHTEAQESLRAQRFAEASARWSQAYALLRDPQYLLAQAEAERRASLQREAIATYERFLLEHPENPARATVEAQLGVLRAEAATPAPAPSGGTQGPHQEGARLAPKGTLGASAAQRPVDTRPLVRRPWFWLMIAGTVVLTGGTAAALILTQTPTEPAYPNLRVFTFPEGQNAK